ncbi:hypothetical protein RUM43_002135 [Polyplax serrata]|uniref:Uncharacterized protein n=1 Tax=Polyplax serrata TaxID=468196 RepID=A0AAN8PZ83_POLSC
MTESVAPYDGFEKIKKIKIHVGVGGVMMSFLPRHFFIVKAEMALFGMVWLLRVKAEMRRCAKCKREEELKLQKLQSEQQQKEQQQQQAEGLRLQKQFLQQHQRDSQRSVEQQTEGAIALVQTDIPQVPLYSSDSAVGFEGTFCEIHGYIPPKEAKTLELPYGDDEVPKKSPLGMLLYFFSNIPSVQSNYSNYSRLRSDTE